MWNKIEAVLRPYKIREILEYLDEAGHYYYLEECRGFGKRLSPLALYKDNEALAVESLPRTKVSIYVRGADVGPLVELLLEKSSTGIIGDGKLFVLSLIRAIEIGTQEIYGEN